jgi:hypothetical protein
MSIRRDLLLRSALLRLPDLAAVRAAAPAALSAGAMAVAPRGAAAGRPARPVRANRRHAPRKAAAASA